MLTVVATGNVSFLLVTVDCTIPKLSTFFGLLESSLEVLRSP